MRIAEAREGDISIIVDLLNEMDRFYGDEINEGKQERAEKVATALFGTDRSAHALLARAEDGEIIGFASYSFLWPAAGSSRSLYLKELYVPSNRRKSGIGRELMQEVFNIAKREQCGRVEWTTDSSNLEARSFYEQLGESVFTGKLFYRHEIGS